MFQSVGVGTEQRRAEYEFGQNKTWFPTMKELYTFQDLTRDMGAEISTQITTLKHQQAQCLASNLQLTYIELW